MEGRGTTAQGECALGLFTPREPSKVVGHEVWPAVRWQGEGQGTTAQGKCALGLIHARGA